MLINIAVCFVKKGFTVNLVCDGKDRHHSKRATIQRQLDAQKKRLQLIIAKSEIMLLSNNRRNTDRLEERNTLMDEEKELQKN
jgi:hypothetical protein